MFISLHELMEELAALQAGDEAARYSAAAGNVYQALHNADERPCWFEITEDGLTLKSNNTDGMAMLLHMAGWKGREMREFLQHVDEGIAAENAGINPALVLRSHSTSGGMYDMKNYMRSYAVGFDRAEIASFLDSREIAQNIAIFETGEPAAGKMMDERIAGEVQRVEPKPVASKKQGLHTGQIALGFDGVKWDGDKWRRNLADCPRWLEGARITNGGKGCAALWDPLKIGKALLAKDEKLKRSLCKAFAEHTILADWKEEWVAYIAEAESYD